MSSLLLKISDIAVYGVRCQSPFHGLNDFDVIECLPPDLMHDVLGGVLRILH